MSKREWLYWDYVFDTCSEQITMKFENWINYIKTLSLNDKSKLSEKLSTYYIINQHDRG